MKKQNKSRNILINNAMQNQEAIDGRNGDFLQAPERRNEKTAERTSSRDDEMS